MGLALKILANPLVTKVAGRLIDKVFNRKGKNGPVNIKVAAAAGAGTIATVIIFVVGLFDPGLADVLSNAELAAAVAAITTVVTAIVGYYQAPE